MMEPRYIVNNLYITFFIVNCYKSKFYIIFVNTTFMSYIISINNQIYTNIVYSIIKKIHDVDHIIYWLGDLQIILLVIKVKIHIE